MHQSLCPPSQALYAWYADQTATQAAAAAAPAPVAAPPPLSAVEACPLATAAAIPPAAAAARQLRKRGAVKVPAGGSASAATPGAAGVGGAAADLFAVSKRANRQRPLVLLVQGAEQADVSCMRDLIKTLALVRPSLGWREVRREVRRAG